MKLSSESLKRMIVETLQEGSREYRRAEEEAFNNFKNVRSLKNQGKATLDDVMAAYEEYEKVKKNRDLYFTPEELEAERADNERRNKEADARDEAERERLRIARVAADDAELRDMMATQPGYKDRGIYMDPDDPGDVDDIFPQRYEESLLYEGDDSILEMFEDATLEEGELACPGCLFEVLQEASCGCPDLMGEAVYQGKTVQLNKPTRGDVKKFKVYVNSGKKDAKGRVKAKKINFGDKKMKIKKSNPKRRKSFRARHKCHTAKDKKTARYWSCKKW